MRFHILLFLCFFTLLKKATKGVKTGANNTGIERKQVTTDQERVFPAPPNLSGEWFLCYRNGFVQACQRHTSNQSGTKTDRKDRKATIDLRSIRPYSCGEDCINGVCSDNHCICEVGWKGRNCQHDIDECTSGSHQCSQLCRNTAGSYSCQCREGFTLASNLRSCLRETVHEYATNYGYRPRLNSARRQSVRTLTSNHRSSSRGKRFQNVQSVFSRRAPLFKRPQNNRTLASFLGEAENTGKLAIKSISHFLAKINGIKKRISGLKRRQHPCRRLRCQYKCAMTSKYNAKCLCRSGYVYDSARRRCVDKNECESEENPCGEHSVCVNVVGGYTCECDVGFLASYGNTSSTRFCQDVDECLTGDHICSERALCVNMPGFYRCVCQDGFHGNGVDCKEMNTNTTLVVDRDLHLNTRTSEYSNNILTAIDKSRQRIRLRAKFHTTVVP